MRILSSVSTSVNAWIWPQRLKVNQAHRITQAASVTHFQWRSSNDRKGLSPS